MTDPHAQVRATLLEDLEELSHFKILDAVDETLADEVLEAYAAEVQVDKRVEDRGVTHVVAEQVLSYLERAGLVATHPTTFPSEQHLGDVVNLEELPEDTAKIMQESAHRLSEDPRSYAELLELYTPLAGDLLAGQEYYTSEDGDVPTDEPVHVELAHNGETVETTLRTTSREVDLGSLLEALNRIVEATTTDERRFSEIEFNPRWAHVTFLTPFQSKTLGNYFSYANGDLKRHLDQRQDGDDG